MTKYILDTRLSNAHYTLCTEAIRQGVIDPEDLNEGRRTLAEQWVFWRAYQAGGTLAAFPSPAAPHIKWGLPHHAIDCNDGPVDRLFTFYRRHDVSVAFNVPRESWHMDCLSVAELQAAAKRIRSTRDRAVLERGESGGAVKWLKHQLHYIRDPNTRRPYFSPDDPKPRGGWAPYFNEWVEVAVRRFQRDHGLSSDGKVGPKTDRKIDAAYKRARKRRRR